ncbi:MAG TPA: hypothetical protein VI316_05185 [Candidatus Dormibacteraeota bacterium]
MNLTIAIVMIALLAGTSCGNTGARAPAPALTSVSAGGSLSRGGADATRRLASDYGSALDTMVITVNAAIDAANAAITAGDNRALAGALQRERAARKVFLDRAGALTFPAEIQTQVNEMLAALRALITDLQRMIESVGDTQLYNRYTDQKDQDKADLYAAVKLIDARLGVSDTVPSPSASGAGSKP